MPTYTFPAYKGRAEHRFDCPACGKTKRLRAFTVEHTVNPFNKNDDGSAKRPSEVIHDAKMAAVKLRDQFAKRPLCASCENALSFAERRAIQAERSALAAGKEG